jgi:GGDEF domain-containing protein
MTATHNRRPARSPCPPARSTPPACCSSACMRRHPGGQICSAGLVAWDRIESTDQLIGRADAALYEVKVAGRNRVIAGT